MAALALAGLGKRFAGQWALRGVDLAVEPGEVVALLGGNGAGKSTLLRCAATLLRPSEGRVEVGGRDALEDGPAARARLGFAGDQPRAWGDLTVEENLRFAARFLPGAAARIGLLLDELGLADRAAHRAGTLSRGKAQRLALARALLGAPAVLLLDEPFAHLDAEGREQALAALARASAAGTAILCSAQDPALAPPGCARAVALRGGRVALDARGSPAQLRAAWADLQEGKA